MSRSSSASTCGSPRAAWARSRNGGRSPTSSAAGQTVRVYVPYGDEWYGYLVRRLAERPANLTLLARALTSKG